MFMLHVARGTGIVFMNLAMLASGLFWLMRRTRSVSLAVIALIAEGFSVAAALLVGTPLEPVAGAAGMIGLVFSILFRIGGGLHLLRRRPNPGLHGYA